MGELDWDLLSSYAGILTLACGSVYAGSFGSLPVRFPADKEEDVTEAEEDVTERMSSNDAWLFPVFGSFVLFGFYLVIKYLGKEWINWFLGWYFSVAGVASVWKSLTSLTRYILGEKFWKSFDEMNFVVKKGSTTLASVSWRTPSFLLLPLAVIPSALSSFSKTYGKSALITDIIGLSFAHNAISLLKIDSFTTGAILLTGLFFYDIWWVFGTEVMVKVATTLDVPIKLLWPKSLIFSGQRGYTMLGLGDIVIPGTLIAFALRYDRHRALQSKMPRQGSFSKPYFYATLTAYFLGLVTTMTVMHNFKTAQPALLYLSPAGILSFFVTAAIRGELREALRWSDVPEVAPSQISAKKVN
ncbi:Minor histocompatibility antigen H13 [Termitomyces sp. J132]|nr:hypothetical protein H2248_005196 [Termitomyces sp. 'cryptogamus']KNZ80520.1 Minor histocompatibility antigen H13 [Termitomyces sp. J132]